MTILDMDNPRERYVNSETTLFEEVLFATRLKFVCYSFLSQLSRILMRTLKLHMSALKRLMG